MEKLSLKQAEEPVNQHNNYKATDTDDKNYIRHQPSLLIFFINH